MIALIVSSLLHWLVAWRITRVDTSLVGAIRAGLAR
jgi:hypothetical protein